MDNSTCDAIIFLKKTMFIREKLYIFISSLVDSVQDAELREKINNFLKEIDSDISKVDPALHEWCQSTMVEMSILKGLFNENETNNL